MGIERLVLYRETNILFLTIYYFGDENLFFFIFLVTRRRSIFEPTASFHWFQHKQRREKTMNHSTEKKQKHEMSCVCVSRPHVSVNIQIAAHPQSLFLFMLFYIFFLIPSLSTLTE